MLPINWSTINGVRTQSKDLNVASEPLWTAELTEIVGGYGVLRSYVQSNDGNIFGFAYDWRRDPNEAVTNLYNYVKNIYSQVGKVQLVTHSMGGLIALAAINTHHDMVPWIQSIVYASTPFYGNPWYSKILQDGYQMFNDDQSLNRETLFTMASAYAFFPTDKNELQYGGFVDANKGTRIPVDMYNVTQWTSKKLGLLQSRNISATELVHLTNSLAQGKMFRNKINNLNASFHPPCAYITSDSWSSVWVVLVQSDFSNLGQQNEVQAPGDGLFGYVNTVPPAVIKCGQYNTTFFHQMTLQDYDVMTQATCDMGNCPYSNGASSAILASIVALFAVLIAFVNL